jgi:hypothetical protein
VDPDVFITLAFATVVVLFAIPAVVLMVRIVRRQKRTDAQTDGLDSVGDRPRHGRSQAPRGVS